MLTTTNYRTNIFHHTKWQLHLFLPRVAGGNIIYLITEYVTYDLKNLNNLKQNKELIGISKNKHIPLKYTTKYLRNGKKQRQFHRQKDM